MTAADQLEAALGGDRRALGRVLSRVERGGEEADAILDAVYPRSGGAHVVGVTGAPGTGKSTLVAGLAQVLRRRGSTVAVVAVDPSSPFSGGALLGDRVRMGGLSGDAGVFVRSMAARGAGGGLAEQTTATVTVLSAAGFDTVLVETVGVGQDELAIAGEAQTTVVVGAPGLGDDVQALKAGIMEVADLLVVNKADRDGADRLVAELRFACFRPETRLSGTAGSAATQRHLAQTAPLPSQRLVLGAAPLHSPPLHSEESPETRGGLRDGPAAGGSGSVTANGPSPDASGQEDPARGRPANATQRVWQVPVLKTVATTGGGVPALADGLAEHRAWLRASGAGAARARALAERHVLRAAAALALRRAEADARATGALDALIDAVAARRRSPAAAARVLLDRTGGGAA